MTWTKEQRQRILEDYWTRATAECPTDGSRLNMDFKIKMGVGVNYRIHAFCPRCQKSMMLNREFDEQKDSFRAWTPQEIAELVDAHYQDDSVICPVCDSNVNHRGHTTTGGPRLKLECARCGNSHIWKGEQAA